MSTHSQCSKIFIRNLTVLDCAIWDIAAGPRGRSWNVDVEWEGETDQEGILIDFSTAKSHAKKLIDEHFDHRLIISEELVSVSEPGRFTCHPHKRTPHTERFLLNTYPSSLSILPNEVFEEFLSNCTTKFESILADTILQNSPPNIKSVKIRLGEPKDCEGSYFFNYLHSLKYHSGNCQRFHGHSNTIEIFKNGIFDDEKSSIVATQLSGKYLIAENYLKRPESSDLLHLMATLESSEHDTDNFVWAAYHGSQGEVLVRIPRQRLIAMPTESTIENIAEWIHETLFKADPTIEVRAYEGLNKGAIYP